MNEYSSAPDDEQNDVYSDNESSNHNSSNHNSTLIRAVVAVTASRRNRRRQPQPMHNSTLTGSMRVEELLNGHAEIIQGMISMKAETFRSISNMLASRELLKPTRNMNVDEQLFIFLSICARGATNRHISYLFQHSIETTSRWFDKVLQVGDPILEEYVADCVPVGGDVDVNADYVFHDGIDGIGPSTGPQQHDLNREAMNQMRDHIADDMWERYQASPWYKQA
ncbi:hypothetical protein TIFTF001_052921 [Ficus carica]|uniref:DUF8040 domain-containing protein n=1 Tax=Ficus carica TaxID=3494 RepID=A0AA88EE21_FICCA|nr:hypothetical protein TIFTF001_052921 [Ficus carica]